MKVHIEFQNQFGKWEHYQVKHNEADAYRVASSRARQTNKRYRLKDDNGRVLDIIN